MTTASGIWSGSTEHGQQEFVGIKPAARDAVPGTTNRQLLDDINVPILDELTDRFGATFLIVGHNDAYALKATQEIIGLGNVVEFTHAFGPCLSDGTRETAVWHNGGAELRHLRSWDYNPTSTAYWLKSSTGQYFVLEAPTTAAARKDLH